MTKTTATKAPAKPRTRTKAEDPVTDAAPAEATSEPKPILPPSERIDMNDDGRA